MERFSQLIQTLGTSTKTGDKLRAMENYFRKAPDQDKVWMIALFTGRRPKRSINSTLLKTWCMEITGLPPWLFEECYHTVGDLAETIALLLPENKTNSKASLSLSDYINALATIGQATEDQKKIYILSAWETLSKEECFVFNKLITGGFRIGVSQQLLIQSLAGVTGMPAPSVAHKISGKWDPATITFSELLDGDDAATDQSKPYPFYLAYPLEQSLEELGMPDEWQAEWKWDGIRGQIILRGNELFVWSRGEELLTEKFPEFNEFAFNLPNGTVLDGEIVALDANGVLPFGKLQTRIGRKQLSKKHLTEAPVGFIAYDLLEWDGEDTRATPLAERRTQLTSLINSINHPFLQLSPHLEFFSWDELAMLREKSREKQSEGLMLKRKDSVYQTGRKRGDWWKWKIDPLTIDAVLIYAQKGHGRRSNLYTDYTFAVKDGDKLVSFTKAYSGLTDKELAQVDAFVKKNALEKFGPVRTVKPELVFELAFEGIAASSRHKSGVALRFPRILRWRKDKSPEEINTLDDLKKLLEIYG